MSEKMIEFIGKAGHFFFAGWVLMMVWTEIAMQYNQPTFGYWTCVGIYWLMYCFVSPIEKK